MVMNMKQENLNCEKIKGNIEVNNYKITNTGTKYNEIISCLDNNDNQTKVTFDLKNNILTRENKELTINIDFKTNKIKYHLKQENKTAFSNIKVNKFQKLENQITITYQTENDTFNLKIEYKSN